MIWENSPYYKPGIDSHSLRVFISKQNMNLSSTSEKESKIDFIHTPGSFVLLELIGHYGKFRFKVEITSVKDIYYTGKIRSIEPENLLRAMENIPFNISDEIYGVKSNQLVSFELKNICAYSSIYSSI